MGIREKKNLGDKERKGNRLILVNDAQRNLLTNKIRQGRLADRFLLTTGVFQMSHTF